MAQTWSARLVLAEDRIDQQDSEEELQLIPHRGDSLTSSSSFPKRLASAVLVMTAVIVLFAHGHSDFKRLADGISILDFIPDPHFVPNPGHRDPQGTFVADTWDHFQLPKCKCEPSFSYKSVPKWAQCATSWQDLLTKQDCSSLSCSEDPEPQASSSGTTTTPPSRCKYASVAMFDATKEMQICCYDLKTAEAFHQNLIKQHWALVGQRNARAGLLIWQGAHQCGPQEYGVDFQGVDLGRNWWGGATSADCQKACTYTPGCQGFSWCQWCGCWLKKFKVNFTDFDRVPKASIYSGFACQTQEVKYPWIWDERAKHTLPIPPSPLDEPSPASMLCIEVILPYSYEVGLVAMQFNRSMSIFHCEKYAVYSSQQLILPGGLRVRKMNTTQMSELGGQWGTALNTNTFMALWRAVILDGDYLTVNWIIKVDPDTVWFPSRLKVLLHDHGYLNSSNIPADGMSLINCNLGFESLHGPLEIFSQNALRTLAVKSAACFDTLIYWGDAQWGEDEWIDQCMFKDTHVKRVYEAKVLAEDHCNHWPGWRSCTADRVGFHPFKDIGQHIACYETGKNISVVSFT